MRGGHRVQGTLCSQLNARASLQLCGLDWAVFKNLRTSTKLFLLCGMFVGAIILATYSLIKEKQIAIGLVRKELVGAQYLEALRGVYALILAEGADVSQGAQQSGISRCRFEHARCS